MVIEKVMESGGGEEVKEALLTVENWGAQALAWFDGVFPPEKRAEKQKEVMKSVVEKLKEALLTVKNWGAQALAWFDGVFPPEKRAEKQKEALLTAQNWGAGALAWFDRVFPPETRADKINHWFHAAKPYLIAAVVLYLVVRFCRGGGGSGGSSKMMKAPGRNHRMPRRVFESNPKGYFRELRSRP